VKVTKTEKELRMDSEYYQIDVTFDVATTAHNLERGNLYIQSEFSSFKKGVKPIKIARSGFIEPRLDSSFFLKEWLALLPFASYFTSC